MKKFFTFAFLILTCFSFFNCTQAPIENVMLNIEGATLQSIRTSGGGYYYWLTAKKDDVLTGNLLFSSLKNIEVKPEDYEITIHSLDRLDDLKEGYFELEKSTNQFKLKVKTDVNDSIIITVNTKQYLSSSSLKIVLN